MSARVRPSEGTGSTLAEWQSRRRRRRRIIISKCFQTLTNSPLSACIPQTAEKATLDTHTLFTFFIPSKQIEIQEANNLKEIKNERMARR